MTLAVKSSSSYMSVVRDAVHIAGVINPQPVIIPLVALLSVSMHGGGGGGDDGGGGSGAEPGG